MIELLDLTVRAVTPTTVRSKF